MIVECLCDFDQLNLAPNNKHNDPALEHAIFMPEVIEKKQVVYFYLAGALDNVAVAEIANLAMYSLYTAAIDYQERHGTTPRVYTIWDEAQIMIAKNIEYVLTQSRSAGIACILAHQAMSQLNPPGGVDLRDLVMQCTHIKQIFGARDPWLMDYISRTSGTTKYYRRGYDVSRGRRARRLRRPGRHVRRPRRPAADPRPGVHRPPAVLPGHPRSEPPSQPVPDVDRPAVSDCARFEAGFPCTPNGRSR